MVVATTVFWSSCVGLGVTCLVGLVHVEKLISLYEPGCKEKWFGDDAIIIWFNPQKSCFLLESLNGNSGATPT